MKVYTVFLYYVGDRSRELIKIFKTEEAAKEYCKLPEGEKPSGICYLRIEEWEAEE